MSPEFATRSTARPGFSPGAPVYSPVAEERVNKLWAVIPVMTGQEDA